MSTLLRFPLTNRSLMSLSEAYGWRLNGDSTLGERRRVKREGLLE